MSCKRCQIIFLKVALNSTFFCSTYLDKHREFRGQTSE
jgi:hypothetical protein